MPRLSTTPLCLSIVSWDLTQAGVLMPSVRVPCGELGPVLFLSAAACQAAVHPSPSVSYRRRRRFPTDGGAKCWGVQLLGRLCDGLAKAPPLAKHGALTSACYTRADCSSQVSSHVHLFWCRVTWVRELPVSWWRHPPRDLPAGPFNPMAGWGATANRNARVATHVR